MRVGRCASRVSPQAGQVVTLQHGVQQALALLDARDAATPKALNISPQNRDDGHPSYRPRLFAKTEIPARGET